MSEKEIDVLQHQIDSAGKILQVADGMKTPVGVVEDVDGNLYVTNYGGGIIKVSSAGAVETFSSDFGRLGVGIDIVLLNCLLYWEHITKEKLRFF